MSIETPKIAGVVSIRQIVMSTLNRIKDYTMRDYLHLMQIAIEGYTELNLWHMDNIEVVYLPFNQNSKIATLPADFVDWLKIGIPVNGKLKVLTRHDKILLPRTSTDGLETFSNTDAADTTNAESLVYFSDHIRCGQFVGGLFGMPGGISEASYRFDRERRTLVFTGTITDNYIVLEYISAGVNLTGSTTIPREAEPALRTYILWQMVENDPRVSMSEKQRREDNHDKAVAMLRDFQDTFTAEEYRQMLFGTSRQTPKR
ncbi:MAG: hypothetical protein BWY95_00066 [Bacteroidetes bacterium ADurb.BinA104]|nr:MAG: hypothetical protein BWY95_00066 [Bacteroidetes bacterium ADurb.BinA104]